MQLTSKFSVKMMLAFLSLMLVLSTLLPSLSLAAESQESELNDFEKELEYLFEEAITLEGDKYILNETIAADYWGSENVAAIEIFIKFLNGETVEVTEAELIEAGIPNPGNGGISTFSWIDCMGNKIYIGTGLGMLNGAIRELLEDREYGKAAREIAELVGEKALKGGFAGFVASLGIWGLSCIGE